MSPASSACLVRFAHLAMSSYARVGARPDEARRNLHGPPLLRRARLELRDGRAQVGRVRPVDVRRERVEVDLHDAVVLAPRVRHEVVRVEASASFATSSRPVSLRYSSWRSESAKTLVVAPISAPMLQMVAMPVAEMVSTPSPKYSMIAPVPPETVRMSATFRMMSLGDVQFERRP